MKFKRFIEHMNIEVVQFCANLKKIVEIVEKVLYNEDKLNEKYMKQRKSACIEYTKTI